MSPYAEGSVAAAMREVERCIAELKTACKDTEVTAWRHVALAMGHAGTAKAQLNAALEIEEMAEEESA